MAGADGLLYVAWPCAVCGTVNETPIDAALGASQRFTEDCAACCRPNLLTIRVRSDEEVGVVAEFDE